MRAGRRGGEGEGGVGRSQVLRHSFQSLPSACMRDPCFFLSVPWLSFVALGCARISHDV